MSLLTIYTNSFPFGTSENFLETEILYHAEYFEKVLIIPGYNKGNMRPLPENVSVLSCVYDKKWPLLKIYLKGIGNFHLILQTPALKMELKKIPILKSLKYLGYSLLTKDRLLNLIPSESIVHYSYWLDYKAFALTLLKLEGKIKKLVSRAHGFDLYDERGETGLTFIKRATINNLDILYCISEHGKNYLSKKFPEYLFKMNVSRLGTPDPGFQNPNPLRSDFTIVSCSSINPNKRVSLILDSLIQFGKKYPLKNLIWYHIGTGKQIDMYIESAVTNFNRSPIKVRFLGQLTNIEVYQFYKTIPADLFLSVSENEGIPVSIMEALSVCIPVLATEVGGIPEIVNEDNGHLISVNTGAVELAEILFSIVEKRNIWAKKRSISFNYWMKYFSAENNYNNFSSGLLNNDELRKY